MAQVSAAGNGLLALLRANTACIDFSDEYLLARQQLYKSRASLNSAIDTDMDAALHIKTVSDYKLFVSLLKPSLYRIVQSLARCSISHTFHYVPVFIHSSTNR